jgi:peroxiredoxin
MPELSQLYEEYKSKNVVVLGVAVDELALVKEFSQATPVSYPLFAAENDGMNLTANLGNDKGILPYTVIIKPDGSVVKTFFGRINKALILASLKPLLTP